MTENQTRFFYAAVLISYTCSVVTITLFIERMLS